MGWDCYVLGRVFKFLLYGFAVFSRNFGFSTISFKTFTWDILLPCCVPVLTLAPSEVGLFWSAVDVIYSWKGSTTPFSKTIDYVSCLFIYILFNVGRRFSFFIYCNWSICDFMSPQEESLTIDDFIRSLAKTAGFAGGLLLGSFYLMFMTPAIYLKLCSLYPFLKLIFFQSGTNCS